MSGEEESLTPEELAAERAALRDLLPWVQKWPLPVTIEEPWLHRIPDGWRLATSIYRGLLPSFEGITLGQLDYMLRFVSDGEGKNLPVKNPEPGSIVVYCSNMAAHEIGSGSRVVGRLPVVPLVGPKKERRMLFIGSPNEWWIGSELAPWIEFSDQKARRSCARRELTDPGVFRGGEDSDSPTGYVSAERIAAGALWRERTYRDWDWLVWKPREGGRPKITFKCWECGEVSRVGGKPEAVGKIAEQLAALGHEAVSLNDLRYLLTQAGRRPQRR